MAVEIGFIGGGNMAYAIAGGFVSKGVCDPSNILVAGPRIQNLTRWKKLGSNITIDNGEVMSKCDVVFLAFKPHMLDAALEESSRTYKSTGKSGSKLVISVLAGVTTSTLKEKLLSFDNPRIIRTLPNTPLLVGDGVVLYCCNPPTTEKDCEWLETNMGKLGLCEKVSEDAIDSLGALSGCGTAFMFLVFEALVFGTVARGAKRDVAHRVAAHMLRGTGAMLCDPSLADKHPAQLKDEVTSPGGSTACGLAVLEKNAVRSALIQAIDASGEKNFLLGKK